MTTLTYTPRGMPTQLARDLISTYWDTRGGIITKPTIIEKPPPDYQRADIRNTGDHVIIGLDGYRNEYVTIGFQHMSITADIRIELQTFTSRQMFYDHVDEVERIIFSKQHNPTDYLLDGFEGHADTTALRAVWGDTTTNSTLSLLTSARQYGTNSMRVWLVLVATERHTERYLLRFQNHTLGVYRKFVFTLRLTHRQML